MCVITVCDKRHATNGEMLAMWTANKDGAGYAFRRGGKVVVVKGLMKFDDLVKSLAEEKPKFPYVIHFRMTSMGGTSKELTHPFPITRSAFNDDGKFMTSKDVLFHNGHWTGAVDKMLDFCIRSGTRIPDGVMSDSRIAAFLCSYVGEPLFRYINGKFVVFGAEKMSLYGEFEKESGLLVSNRYWAWDLKREIGRMKGTTSTGQLTLARELNLESEFMNDAYGARFARTDGGAVIERTVADEGETE